MLLTALHSAGQKIESYEPEKVRYKTNAPDSSKLPVSEAEVRAVFSALSFEDSMTTARNTHQFWLALKDPAHFDGRYRTWCFFTGEGEKPVLALWTRSASELMYARGLFIQRFFCSYYGFNKPDTADQRINDRLRNVEPLVKIDPPISKNSNEFKGTVRQRLTQLKPLIEKQGLSFLFLAKGAYYSNQFAAMVVRTAEMDALRPILNKMGLPTLSWQECMEKKVKSRL